MSCHVISYHIIYYIILLWDHRRICGPSLTETSLCGAYLYLLYLLPPLSPVSFLVGLRTYQHRCSSHYSLDLCATTCCLYLSAPSSRKMFSSKMFQFHSCISCENLILQYPTRVIIHKNGSVKGLFVEIMAGVETVNFFRSNSKRFYTSVRIKPNQYVPKHPHPPPPHILSGR
jgi:hypothetical protein